MPSTSELAIEASGLVKTFGATRAVDGVDLAVPTGGVYGFLGPNGAGKTSTIRVLATLLRPDGGTVRVLGHDAVAEASAVRRRVSLTGQFASIDEDLTGRENLTILARLLGFTRPQAKARADRLLERFGLAEAAGRLVKTYSGGMRRRLDIAASILVTPDLLFLDEPTTGLDPRSRNQVWDIIRALVRKGTTVLLTTQNLDEADQLADRIAVIDHGHIIAEGTPAQLKSMVGSGTLHVRVREQAHRPEAERLLTQVLGTPVRPADDGAALSARVSDPERVSLALVELTRARIDVTTFALGQQSRRGLPRSHRPPRRTRRRPGERSMTTTPITYPEPGSTASGLDDALSATPRPAPATPLSASMTFAARALLKIKHVPEQLADAIMLPILFTVMFTYLFGGALAGSTRNYLQFLLPGTMVFAVLLITVYAGVNVITDRHKGVMDRFRAMPIWRPAFIVGALISDAGRSLLAAALVIALGLAMGFRPDGGVTGVVLAVALILVFAFALSWVWTTLGLVLRTPTSVTMVSFLVQFPLTFASNVFVDPKTMPGWVETFVDINPVSHLVDAARGLMHGTATTGQVAGVLATSVALVAVFGPLTMHLYRTKA